MKNRLASLDGVRGVAVLVVVLLHHGLLNAGWMGVDLFFVLSGYLITSILRRTRNDLSYYKEFWIKRATRIFPPLLLLLLTAFLLDKSMGVMVLLNLLSLGDILAYRAPGFEASRVLWSLAIEEHFYLVWPFLVRRLHRQQLIAILIAIVAVEPVLRGVVAHFKPDEYFIYYLTPFRLDGLSLGALLALALESSTTQAVLKRVSLWGCMASVGVFFTLKLLLGPAFEPGGSVVYNALAYSLVSFSAFFLISHLIVVPSSLLARVLSSRALVFVGTISYGIYLYQIVVRDQTLRFAHLPWDRVILVSLPALILISWLSFRCYERPLILWGKRRSEQLHFASDSLTEVTVQSAP